MNTRIRTLDGIRGLAISLVLVGHAVDNYQPMDLAWRRWLDAFANAGAGVRLFFVLSGYLITHLLLREMAATGTLSIRQFYWRRVLRIFPAFYLYLLTITALSYWQPMGVNRHTFIAAATFSWNYLGIWTTEYGGWPLGHLWTLALEQQFYLLWPVVLLLAGRRRALWIAAGLMLWCPLARVGSYYLFPAQRGLLGMMFHTSVDSLMAGCAAALLLTSATWREWLKSRGSGAVATTLTWLLLLSPLLSQLVRGFSVAFGMTLDAMAASFIVAWVHYQPTLRIQRVLSQGLLPLLGVISYSLYLWQQPFLSPMGWLADGNVVLPLLAACGAAVLSYHFVEQPFLRLKGHVASRAQATAVPIPHHDHRADAGLGTARPELMQTPGPTASLCAAAPALKNSTTHRPSR